MEARCVLFDVEIEFLNIIQKSFCYKSQSTINYIQ